MLKILKYFEYVYLALFVFSIIIIYQHWGINQQKANMFIILGIVCLFMFFFRRYFRIKLEKIKSEK